MGVTSKAEHLLWGAYSHSRKCELVSDDDPFTIEEPEKLAEDVYDEVQYFSHAGPWSYWISADNVAGFVKEGFIDRLMLSEDVWLSKQIKYRSRKNYGDLLKTYGLLLLEQSVRKETVHTMKIPNSACLYPH